MNCKRDLTKQQNLTRDEDPVSVWGNNFGTKKYLRPKLFRVQIYFPKLNTKVLLQPQTKLTINNLNTLEVSLVTILLL